MALGFGDVEQDAPRAAKELARRLRSVAERAGYTGVRELAAATGIGRTTISDALTARRVPGWEKLAALLRGCGVTPDRDWADAQEAARAAVEERKRAARAGGRPGGEPEAATPAAPAAPPGPGTFSIRPPYGELPPRVRGRDELLNRLATALAEGESRAQVLYGMGGCGKTTVALDLARQARDRGYRVFWLSTATPERLLTGMREVARELGAEEEDIEAAWAGRISATDLVWGRLDAAERPWLLVLDNADEPEWLAAAGGVPGDGTGWLRSSRAGLTVVTSRVGTPGVWGREANTHRVGVLAPADGRDVLLDLAGEAGDPAEAQVLAERLDGLPLALKLAGSYLARSARGAGLLRHRGRRPGGRVRSFAAYTEALGEAGAGFLDQGEQWRLDEAGTEQMHRRLVGRTWELSLDLLEEQQLPEARAMMRLLSCCAPAPFPVELLDPGLLPVAGPHEAAGAAGRGTAAGPAPDPDRADRALEALVDLNLVDVVDIGPDGPAGDREPVPCLVAHRLVLEANALRLADAPPAERLAIWRATARILQQGAEPASEEPANWPWWRLLAPHVVAALGAAPDGDAEEVLLPLLRAGLSEFAFAVFTGDLTQDRARLLVRRSAALAPDHPVRLSVRHRAAFTLLEGEEELREYEAVVAEQMAQLGADHPETLITRYNVALARHSCGLMPLAGMVAELRAVRRDRRRVLGPGNPYTLLPHADITELLPGDLGEEHLPAYEAVLAGQVAELGADHPEALVTRHDVAIIRYRRGLASAAETESELRAVVRTVRKELGSGDPYTLLAHGTLAELMMSRDHGESAGNAEYRALVEHTESRSPTDHSFLPLQQRHQMAHALDMAKRWAEAEAEYRSVLEDLARGDATASKLYWDLMRCLADNLAEQERHPEALVMLDDALVWFDGSDEAHSTTRPEALKLRHKRGDLLVRCDRPEEGERQIRAVLADRLRTVDPQDSVVLSERHCLAHALSAMERHDEARDELRDVAASYHEILGPHDKLTRSARFCLARTLHTHGDRSEALTLYEQVLAAETAELGADHEETLMTGFRRDQCRLDLGLLAPPEAAAAFGRTLAIFASRLGDEHRWTTAIREALAATGAA
ncbi:tetratricopeptide repeat protein [Streptomyces pactum]|uniref:Tetratricopeptide repeat protein n=1 Tax=Streptomyces pactum TaxID=68249 RepID=A0ABS0NML5_9ACTN|nr:helix-turn-helix domain-containing protein [Streptomyces pactum]MBH5336427.1 tetratricopeptide repeat protein [Streptomyces pactum]